MKPVDDGRIPPYRVSAEACVADQGSDATRGLGSEEVRVRLERDGRNELDKDPQIAGWRLFLEQFRSVLVLLLLFAALVSTVVWAVGREPGLPHEALAILAVVVLNAWVGYSQSRRSRSALDALERMSPARARVVRDGKRKMVDGVGIVVGDLLAIEEGDAIAADARVLNAIHLHMSEASLTGESLPVAKGVGALGLEVGLADRSNMVFSGTSASSGRGLALVVATGMRTEMGGIAKLMSGTPRVETPLEIELRRIGWILGLVVVAIALAMIATIAGAGKVTGWASLLGVAMLGVALAVAAVPEGLPALVTVVLALGVQRMAGRKAIVRNLSAVEALGSVTVIASDKTGTLTENQMTVRVLVVASGKSEFGGEGYGGEGEVKLLDAPGQTESETKEGGLRGELVVALTAAERSSNATVVRDDGRWVVQGDPTEGALVVAAGKIGLVRADLDRDHPRCGEIPFSSDRRMMTTVHQDTRRPDRLWVFTKGAPEGVLARCDREFVGGVDRALTPQRRSEIEAENAGLADRAMRTLAFARREVAREGVSPDRPDPHLEESMVFLGLVGMIDPPRKEAKRAVAQTRSAGIRAIMVTGDHSRTASVIAADLGIAGDGKVLSGEDLAGMTDLALDRAVATVSVFARVDPGQKLLIVQALRRTGAVVAMTGDGVNDAPALKAADIGVAMGRSGTDVARAAADIVLADDNYATIVEAVEEGRAVFENIRKFLRYLLSSNVGEVMTMFLAVVFAESLGLHDGAVLVIPLLAAQILWVNLVTDSGPALALGVDPPDDDLMVRPPRPPGEGVFTGRMWVGVAVSGAVIALGTLAVMDASLPGGMIDGDGTVVHARTMAFTTLVLFQLFNCFQSRSETASVFHGLFANRWLWGAVAGGVLLQVAVVHLPFLQRGFSTTGLAPRDWLLCAAVASSILWIGEALKLSMRLAKVVRVANRTGILDDSPASE